MLVQVLDAESAPHFVAWQGQDQINDFSGNLGAGAVGGGAALQQVAPANTSRAGFLFQNTSVNAMLLVEVAGLLITSSWVINPGAFFPPFGNYPIPTGVIAVQGSLNSVLGDTFAYREWQAAPGE
jgi:hypothetical protein